MPKRRLAEQVVQRLSRLPYLTERVPAEVGKLPQFTVDNYLRADQCGIVFCILCQCMGTAVTDPKTKEQFQSGTEFEAAIQGS
ncbi:MAG: hypothetical protein ABIQ00_14015 [Chitinophagaceae bacterium]